MPIIPILFGVAALAVIAGLASSSHTGLRSPKRRNVKHDAHLSLAEELDADPIGTIAKYGTAADLQAQGFGDEIRGLGYRP